MYRNKNILWSTSYQNEVLEYLRNKDHSSEVIKEILPLIMQGPPKSVFRESIDNDIFNELKERGIYKRLSCLKDSGIQFPEDVENEYRRIQKKYSIQSSEVINNDQKDFLFSHKEAHWVGSEKRYHNWTDEQIFKEIKYTKPYTYPDIDCKKENFRSFIIDFPERAFKVLSMFQGNDINSTPYWDAVLNEISSIKNTQQSNEYFFESLNKIESFGDEFVKKYLWSLIDAWDYKAGSIYYTDKNYFKKWWDKLWKSSVENADPLEKDLSDFSFGALNSELGKLSHSIFRTLWSKFPETIPKGGKIPEDIKNYFQVILQEGVNINLSVLFHFGSDLYVLWHLDRKWTIENIRPLMDWKHNQDVCRALWSGYLYHMRLNSDFLADFRSEFFHLLLNGKKFYTQESNDKIGYCEAIAELFFITTGGKWISNIFEEEETKKLVQNMDTDILESISRKMWVLLKDAKDKSANLWSEKIKFWWQKCWLHEKKFRTSKIAQNLSLVILHCGKKLPKTFELLEDKIEEEILQNNNYIVCHIEDNNEELNYIFDYPKQLLTLLNWNFPEKKILYYYDEKVRKILDTLKEKYPDIEKNEEYNKLIEKVS